MMTCEATTVPDDPRRIATPLSEDELQREAVVTERDKILDVLWWRQWGSPLTNALLDAQPKGE